MAALNGMRLALETLASKASTSDFETQLGSIMEFDRFLGIERARESAQQYGLLC
jgi:hypothetical protein